MALSTTEAEYVSLSACCAQVIWMRTQLTDYGFNFNKIPIYCDSKSTIAISCNPVEHLGTKNIVVRYHFIKEHVEKGTIELYFVKTDYQLADLFTKALPLDRFNYLVRRLGMRSLSPRELERLAKSQSKQPIVVPISTREPKQTVNQSATTPLKKIVATKSTNQKPRIKIRKKYEHVSKTCRWWYSKITPPGYKWKPKTSTVNVTPNLVEIILFIIDSRCSKHMTRNLKLLSNFVEKFLGTVKFGNDQIALILGYGDLVEGNVTIIRVYYVEGINHNLFFVGQFYDADLEVAFRKSTCYIRDLKGNIRDVYVRTHRKSNQTEEHQRSHG
ncbi:hypothetical protein Tco_1140196 [Tanacetum coccineum]